MYDDKKIKIIKRSDLIVDDNGVPSYTWNEIGEYWVDLQPITQEKCIKIFGSYPNVKYQIWLERKIEGFNTVDFKVIYKEKEYSILNIVEWDDDWYCLNFAIGVDDIGS